MRTSTDNIPIRIQKLIVDALSQLTCVQRIVSFGATAMGSHDQWSDIDLMVVCSHCDDARWLCTSMIREVLPVLFYRPFTAREQPCGRYWFKHESPMSRLDISFEMEAAYEDILSASTKDGYKVVLREEYVATCDAVLEQDKSLARPWQPVAISQEEVALGRLLYRALEAVKFALRGDQSFKWNRERCVRELQAALQEYSCKHFDGGDLKGLADKCFRMNDIFNHLGFNSPPLAA